MDILKIISVGLIGAITFVYLKSVNSELSGLLVLGTSIVIIIMILSYLIGAVDFFKDFVIKTQIDSALLILIVKITAIAYLIEFANNLCEDLGAKSIGTKIEFAGRIVMFVMSIPLFKNLIETLNALIL